MPTKYTVKPGDHISSIAEEFKFRDFKTIWEDGLNAGLKALRKSAHVLNPGDELQIPDKVKREETVATAKYHVFEAKLQPLQLRIRLQDEQGEARKEKDCEIEAESTAERHKSDGDGKVLRKVPRASKKGRLRIDTTDVNLIIGGLDTEDTPQGQQARLTNLGYYRGPAGAVDEKELKSAIEEFQCDNKLAVDGICGPMTQAKLKEIHGS